MALNTVRRHLLMSVLKSKIQYNCKMSTGNQISEKYETLAVSSPKEFLYTVQLNRPPKLNALNDVMWREIKNCFNELATEPDCRVIILSGSGHAFCAGIDLHDVMKLISHIAQLDDLATKCKILQQKIRECQDTFTAIEKCPKPVIAAIHGSCIGAGVDMISAADIRYCTSDAWFQIKETEMGLAADVGTLQRFPKIIGSDSLVRELVYTARRFTASEALQHGFVNRLFDDEASLFEGSVKLAEQIASQSLVAVQGSKLSLNYSRDHSVQEGLDHIAMHNQVMLQTEHFIHAVTKYHSIASRKL